MVKKLSQLLVYIYIASLTPLGNSTLFIAFSQHNLNDLAYFILEGIKLLVVMYANLTIQKIAYTDKHLYEQFSANALILNKSKTKLTLSSRRNSATQLTITSAVPLYILQHVQILIFCSILQFKLKITIPSPQSEKSLCRKLARIESIISSKSANFSD